MDTLAAQTALASLIANFKRNTLCTGRENLTLGVISGRLSLLERYWGKFQSQHDALLADEQVKESAYFTEDAYATTEVEYTTVLGYLLDEQARLSSGSGASVSRADSTASHAQLPKITIPNFSGKQGDWESFRDLFQALIHREPRLSAVQKFYYLRTALCGDARTAIESLPLTESNYLTAWNLLVARFDNKRIRIQEHLKAIANIEAVKKESVQALQHNLDEPTRRRDALRNLDCPVVHWDDWLVFFGSRGMDETTRRDWEKELGSTVENATFEQ